MTLPVTRPGLGRITLTATPPPETTAPRPVREFRVRFPALLSDAAPAPAPSPPPPAPRSEEFWATRVGKEVQADRESIEAALAGLRVAVEDHRKAQVDRLGDWQRAAVELAATIAARLIHERVEAGDFPIDAKVRDMLARHAAGGPVTIWLNPADVELLEKRLDGQPLLPDRAELTVSPDPTLPRAACRVEGGDGIMLADVTRELTEIRDDLIRSLTHARS